MNKAAEALIYLSSGMINQNKIDPDYAASIDLDALFSIAHIHQMTAVAASALKAAGIDESRFQQEKMLSVSSTVNFNRERTKILKELEENRIWYMPLKGVILKDYYPQIGMRQMSDNDILIDPDRAEDIQKIMSGLGYETAIFEEGHRDDYRKPPVLHFEMHRVLFDSDIEPKAFYEYYKSIKDRLVKDPDREYGYHFSDEDFYIYMIAHEYKHYSWGGTGLRSLMDVYVYLKNLAGRLDWNYIKQEIQKLEITDFERLNRRLALKVFHAGGMMELTSKEKEMLDFYVSSGTYGKNEHMIRNYSRRIGLPCYVVQRIFPSMEAIKRCYPVFYHHKLLLPLLPVFRLLKNRKNAAKEIRILIADRW